MGGVPKYSTQGVRIEVDVIASGIGVANPKGRLCGEALDSTI